ncbi:hypothetical protein YC2023_070617 [Brassica napus]
MDIWIPWTVQLVMVLFGYGPIWIWSYLGSTKNAQKKINPSEHVQIHPVRPIDIPSSRRVKKDEEYDAILGIVRETPPELKLSTA